MRNSNSFNTSRISTERIVYDGAGKDYDREWKKKVFRFIFCTGAHTSCPCHCLVLKEFMMFAVQFDSLLNCNVTMCGATTHSDCFMCARLRHENRCSKKVSEASIIDGGFRCFNDNILSSSSRSVKVLLKPQQWVNRFWNALLLTARGA